MTADELVELKAAIERLETAVTIVIDALLATIEATVGDDYPNVQAARFRLETEVNL